MFLCEKNTSTLSQHATTNATRLATWMTAVMSFERTSPIWVRQGQTYKSILLNRQLPFAYQARHEQSQE